MLKRPRFVMRLAVDGRPYWVLIAGNGETLCTSETYETVDACRKGVRAARTAAWAARFTGKFDGQ